jgi:shikimate kinase
MVQLLPGHVKVWLPDLDQEIIPDHFRSVAHIVPIETAKEYTETEIEIFKSALSEKKSPAEQSE